MPIKITGPGTLDLRDDGIHVVGHQVANNGRALLFLLALFGSVVTFVVAKMALGLSDGMSGGVSTVMFAGMVGAMLKRPAQDGAKVEQVFAWSKVKKVVYDAGSECLVVVVKGMKPSGGLFIVQPMDSALEQEIKARLG